MPRTGGSNRRTSSTKAGIRSGSARSCSCRVRPLAEQPDAGGDRLRGRLLPAAEEQHEEPEHRAVVERVALRGAGGDQRRDHVVARLRPAHRDEAQEQLSDLDVALGRRPRHLGLGVADDLLLPVQEELAVFDGDADGVGDHGRRERPGQRVEHLHPTALGEAVDEAAGDGADAGLSLGHGVGREPAADDATVARVEGRVDVLELVLHPWDVGVEQLAHVAGFDCAVRCRPGERCGTARPAPARDRSRWARRRPGRTRSRRGGGRRRPCRRSG